MNKLINIDSCPICKSNKSSIILKTDIDTKLQDIVLNINQCSNCKHNYTNPITAPEFLNEIYSKFYYSYNYDIEQYKTSEKSTFKKWYFEKYHSKNYFIKGFIWLIGKQLAGYPTPRRSYEKIKVLDIGCGNGVLLNFLKSVGFETYGLELSPSAVNTAVKNGHICKLGTFDNVKYQDKFFSAITLIHVLEHFMDPVKELTEINRILEDNGELVIVVPNFNYVDRFIFNKYWMALLASEHFQQFTFESLKNLVETVGFKIVTKKLIFRPYLFSNLRSYYIRKGLDFKFIILLITHFFVLLSMVFLFPFVFLGLIEPYGVYISLNLKKVDNK
jgi:2-polyprenyl-3-methyl-5-hydroxy-6-metoxy-1,4-benzoquinol methylase